MKRRRILLGAGVFALGISLLEITAVAIYPLLGFGRYSRSAIQQALKIPVEELAKPDNEGPEPAFIKTHMLHPYLGFAMTPDNDAAPARGINEAGFMGVGPVIRKSPDRVNICLLGGSVAGQLYSASRETLKKALGEIGPFQGKEIIIVPLVVGGWKQPQQLLALTYFLSAGAEYDVVINLDGFNEVALPFGENVVNGVYPFYPRLWNVYASRFLDVEGTVQFAALVSKTAKRQNLRRTFGKPLLSFLNFSLILWKVLDRRLEADISEQTATMQQLASRSDSLTTTRNFERAGPTFKEYSSPTDLFAGLAKHWARSSLQMHHIATSSGARYFHFLQPNQYVANSKPFSRAEHTVAIHPLTNFAYRVGVETGYPMLVAEGKDLITKGVQFTDLTRIFAGNSAVIYQDICCHVNKVGSDLIAARIAATVAEHYRKAPMMRLP